MPSDLRTQALFDNQGIDFSWVPTDDEIAVALELNTLSSFRLQFRRLRTKYRTFREILEAPPGDLAIFDSWASNSKKHFIEKRDQLKIGNEKSRLPNDVKIITYFDKRYPQQLRELYDPPPVLYVKRDLTYDFSTSISIVGTRSVTEYGRRMTEQFAYQLASWGFTVISGGARGIDSIAHKAALDAGGKTIAVYGCGIDVVFPAENQRLFYQIAENGVVISEFPMGTIPERRNFPARNRIIAALGRGVFVVEAPEKSGALITADLALQLGREVFTVPGRLTDSRSKGTNKLIRDGAHIILDTSDIPLIYGLTVLVGEIPDSETVATQLSGDEALVYQSIGLEAKEADMLVREIGIPAQRFLSAILILQTRGLVKELPGSRFVRPVNPMKMPSS